MSGVATGLLRSGSRTQNAQEHAERLEVAALAPYSTFRALGVKWSWRTVGTFRMLCVDDDYGMPETVVFAVSSPVLWRCALLFLLLGLVFGLFFGVVARFHWHAVETAHGYVLLSVVAVEAIVAIISLWSIAQLAANDPGIVGADTLRSAHGSMPPLDGGVVGSVAQAVATHHSTSQAMRADTQSAKADSVNTSFTRSRADRVQILDQEGRLITAHRPFCTPCGLVRPLRAAHCSVCHICVANYDHHCGVTGGCIGRNNIGAFTRFVVGCAVSSVLIGGECAYLFFSSDDPTAQETLDAAQRRRACLGVEIALFVAGLLSVVPLVYAAFVTVRNHAMYGVTLREKRKGHSLFSGYTVADDDVEAWGTVPRPFDRGCVANSTALCGCSPWPVVRVPSEDTTLPQDEAE